MPQQIFEALYTPQLIQKRKKWHDGKCLYFSGNKKLVLLDEDGHTMAERFWSGDSSPEIGTTFQLDRYLVELDTLLRTVSQHEVSDASSHTRTPTRKPPTRPLRPLSRPGSTLGRPLSDVLQDASMRIKPLGSGPLEKRVKRVKADKFGGLPPALLGLDAPVKPEVIEKPSASNADPINQAVKLESHDNGATHDHSHEPNHHSPVDEPNVRSTSTAHPLELPDDADLFVGEPFLLAADKSFTAIASHHDLSPAGTPDGDSDDLFSDTEVEILDVKHTPRTRRSLFEDLPDECPIEGPWTKEAYLLFSWHPPQPKVKQEPA